MDSENRLSLLLIGLTVLRRRLAMAMHESLAQRIDDRCHLNGLSHQEVGDDLEHRPASPEPTRPSSSPAPSRPSLSPATACPGASAASPSTSSTQPPSPRGTPSQASMWPAPTTNTARDPSAHRRSARHPSRTRRSRPRIRPRHTRQGTMEARRLHPLRKRQNFLRPPAGSRRRWRHRPSP